MDFFLPLSLLLSRGLLERDGRVGLAEGCSFRDGTRGGAEKDFADVSGVGGGGGVEAVEATSSPLKSAEAYGGGDAFVLDGNGGEREVFEGVVSGGGGCCPEMPGISPSLGVDASVDDLGVGVVGVAGAGGGGGVSVLTSSRECSSFVLDEVVHCPTANVQVPVDFWHEPDTVPELFRKSKCGQQKKRSQTNHGYLGICGRIATLLDSGFVTTLLDSGFVTTLLDSGLITTLLDSGLITTLLDSGLVTTRWTTWGFSGTTRRRRATSFLVT